MEENKKMKAEGLSEPEDTVMGMDIEEISEEEARELQQTFKRFIEKYKENPERDTKEWLSEQLRIELPEKEEEEIQSIAKEIAESVAEYEADLNELNQAARKGITKESWFADKVEDSARGMAVNQFGNYLNEVDQCLADATAQMVRTVMRADEGISQSLNLDGFIAEQYHVNSFNAKAVLEQTPYRARVCVPEHGYAKDSVDVMIDNIKTGERGIQRYQVKFGKDAESTIQMLRRGNYNNQRLVVPKDQVQAVSEAFPGKTVTAYIGGNEVTIQSDAVTKEDMKLMQENVQENSFLPKTDWNSYQTRDLVRNIGKQAGMAGIQAAFLGVGISLAKRALSKEPIEADEVIKTALETGADTSVKAAAGGALKAISEKGLLSVIPPGTPAGTLAKIACVGIEDIKILWKVAKGEMTMSEALEHMGRTSISVYAGLSGAAVGAGAGIAALSWIPVVGPIVGGLIGGVVGYTAGSKAGEKIFEGAKKVVKKGIELVKNVGRGIRNVVTGIRNLLPF